MKTLDEIINRQEFAGLVQELKMEQNKTEEKKKKRRPSTATVRKGCERGIRTQKMVSFRCDLEVKEQLEGVQNKGRLINDLLREHFKM